MSSRPHHSPPPIPDSASSPTSPFRRPADGCATSTPFPPASPMTCSGSEPVRWLDTADQCVANTPKRSLVPPFTTRLPPMCSPGSRLPSSSLRTHVYVRSVVAGTPAAGPVCYVSHLLHSCFPSPNLPFPRAAIYHRVTRHARAPHAPFSGINHSYFIFADDVDPRPTTLAFHPLFYYLHFSAGAELDPSNVLHTLLPTHPDCRRKVYAPLCSHSSASCAFVTSPPVRSITLLRPDSESVIASVRNPDGCTVLDVNRLLGDLCVVLLFCPCLLVSLTGPSWNGIGTVYRVALPTCVPSCPIIRRCWTTIEPLPDRSGT
jgi:hypothetical protein